MLPRHHLPQIDKTQIDNFRKWMAGQSVSSKLVYMSPKHLIPAQKHLKKSKIKSIQNDPPTDAPPIIIANDNKILDGHHRWAAELLDNSARIICIQFNCSFDELWKLGHLFPPSNTKTIHESNTYSNKNNITVEMAKKAAHKLQLNFDKLPFSFQSFHKGMNVELEHKDVTHGDVIKTAKIALAHLRERSDYYEKLEKYVEN